MRRVAPPNLLAVRCSDVGELVGGAVVADAAAAAEPDRHRAGRRCRAPAGRRSASAAELAIRVRRVRSRPGEVARALAEGDLVIAGGAVSGTWTLTDDEVVTAWFTEAGRAPKTALADEVQRLAATILDRPLRTRVEMA